MRQLDYAIPIKSHSGARKWLRRMLFTFGIILAVPGLGAIFLIISLCVYDLKATHELNKRTGADSAIGKTEVQIVAFAGPPDGKAVYGNGDTDLIYQNGAVCLRIELRGGRATNVLY